MINKKFLFTVLIILFYGYVWSQVSVIELGTEAILDFDTGNMKSYWYDGENVYITSYYDVLRINPETRDIYKVDKFNEFNGILGRYNNNFLVSRLKEDRSKADLDESGYIDIYIYNPKTEEYTPLSGIQGGARSTVLKWLYHYYDDYYLGSREPGGPPDGQLIQELYNNKEGTREEYQYIGMRDLSFDKLTGVYYKPGDPFQIVNIQTKETIGKIYEHLGSDNIFFMANNLIGLQDLNHLYIYNLTGELLLDFKYIKPENIEVFGSSYHKIRNSQYTFTGVATGGRVSYMLLKTPDEMDYLDSLGLLFHPTIATANDSRVRIREWPLLDAKHLGYLTKGDKLEILDRSGIKVKIGEMEDYWYKLRRVRDGMEGWSYGAFIDLDEE